MYVVVCVWLVRDCSCTFRVFVLIYSYYYYHPLKLMGVLVVLALSVFTTKLRAAASALATFEVGS